MKKLLPYLANYKKECILSPVFKMLEAIFELFVPLVVAAMIDQGIGYHKKGFLFGMSMLLVLLAIVGLGVSITAQYFAAKAAVGFATSLRQKLFSHLQSLSHTEIDAMGASTMITRMTGDITLVQNGVNMVLRLVLRSPFVVFGAMIMAFTIDPWTATVFVAVICGLSAVVFLIMNFNIPMMNDIQKKTDALTQTARENLTGVRVIRAFVKEQEEIARFKGRNEALLTQQEKTGKISALMNPLTYVIVNIGIILLIRSGAVQVDRGALTQGEVIALYNYMSQILVELIKLANLIVTINRALAGAGRVSEALEVKSSMSYPAVTGGSSQSAIPGECVSFSNVSLTYKDGGQPALSEINFTAMMGWTVGIIGGTGCGKSSLVNLIPRFYDTTSGSVRIFGKDVRDYTKNELSALVSVTPQKAVLFAGTIADNLRWGKEDATAAEMQEAVLMAQAGEVVEKKGGLSAVVEPGGKNFSGGQRQRLTVARALVGKKPILILDDSSSALDMVTDKRLREALRTREYPSTTFIVSQRTAAISDADMILVMDNGRIVASGKHEELLATCDLYREIHETQQKGAREVSA
ncbi:MAG: ABC transporter ATP-binding protein/permease [Lachnospiraceae bacterium]|nr:ABC transporter ATP-binding protein/permease [Lachnospiraceae bacterium]